MRQHSISLATSLWERIFCNLRNRESKLDPLDNHIATHRQALTRLVTQLTQSFSNNRFAHIKQLNDCAWNIPGSDYYAAPRVAKQLYHCIFSNDEEHRKRHYRTKFPNLLLRLSSALSHYRITPAEAQVGLLVILAEEMPELATHVLPSLIQQAKTALEQHTDYLLPTIFLGETGYLPNDPTTLLNAPLSDSTAIAIFKTIQEKLLEKHLAAERTHDAQTEKSQPPSSLT